MSKKETGLTVKTEVMKNLEAISQKLEAIKLVSETIYKTSGVVKWNPYRNSPDDINVHRCDDVNTLIQLLAIIITDMNSYEAAVKDLGLTTYPAFVFSGYSYESWKHDIKIRIAQLNAKEQISKLNKAKSILESYMSHDDRLAMALKEIKEMGI